MKSIVLTTITVLSLTACGEDLSKIEATRHISCKSAAETAWISGYNPKTMTYEFTSKDTKSPEAYKLIHKTELIAAKFREEFRKQKAVAMEKKDYKSFLQNYFWKNRLKFRRIMMNFAAILGNWVWLLRRVNY